MNKTLICTFFCLDIYASVMIVKNLCGVLGDYLLMVLTWLLQC